MKKVKDLIKYVDDNFEAVMRVVVILLIITGIIITYVELFMEVL